MGLFGGRTNNAQNSKLLGFNVQTSISGSAIKIVFGFNRIPGNVIWTGDWKALPAQGKAGKGKYGGNYDYHTAAITALCYGPIGGIAAVWQNLAHNGSTTNFLNAYSPTELDLTVVDGNIGQSPWSYLTTNHPDQALGYSQLAYVAKEDWDLGTAGTMPNYSYEVQGLDCYESGLDALCSQVVYRLLTDSFIGAGFQTAEVDISEMQAYCVTNNIVISPVLDQQEAASKWIGDLLLVGNSEAVWSGGILKLRTRDTSITGIVPIYDLTDDDFKDRDEPVRISRPNIRDAYNSVKLEWTNRGNQYNKEPLEQQDQALIDAYGYRPASSIDALGVTTADVATKVANVQLKKQTAFIAKYKFKLGFEHMLLEPMDIVTLTRKTATGMYLQGLNRKPVRLLSLSEDADGYLDCEAEDVYDSAGVPVSHPAQAVGSFSAPLNAQSGSVNTPVFYEAAYQMRQALYSTQYALVIALSGGPYWGGCTVHRSWDGTTYEVVGRQVGATPMGVLSANLASGADPDSSNTLSVNLLESFGTLQSVSLSDADNFKTLSVLGGGTSSELVSYETATLTSKYNYDLTYLRRGVYQSPIASHATNDSYFLVQNAFVWIYQAQDIGKTVHFKFTSFNQYGGAEQLLSDATDYTYTLTGGLSAVKTVTSDYTIQPADPAVNADTSGGDITVTLPTASSTVNTTTVITNTGTGTLTIAGGGSGVGTTSLTEPYQSITVQSTPTGWIQISSNITPRFADDETPTGTLDGVNGTFTLAHVPLPSVSLQLKLNGVDEIAGVNYTLSGSTITFTTHVPASTSTLKAWYRY